MTKKINTASFALLGRTNVGKSTLLNHLLNEDIAITSHKHHTTRTKILGVLNEDNYQLIFLDTPGLGQKTHNPIQRLMMRTTQACMTEADVFLFMIDTENLTSTDHKLLEILKEHHKEIILIINKIDVLDHHQLEHFITSPPDGVSSVIPLSAKRESNLDLLIGRLKLSCEQSTKQYEKNYITNQTRDVMMSEIVREQILTFCHQEVPHELKVEIEKYIEKPKINEVHVLITVKNNNHKKIIIGKQGQNLKRIGTNARLKIEHFLNKKVMMKIWVKVDDHWMDSAQYE